MTGRVVMVTESSATLSRSAQVVITCEILCLQWREYNKSERGAQVPEEAQSLVATRLELNGEGSDELY